MEDICRIFQFVKKMNFLGIYSRMVKVELELLKKLLSEVLERLQYLKRKFTCNSQKEIFI